jgi:hypothetical protein
MGRYSVEDPAALFEGILAKKVLKYCMLQKRCVDLTVDYD